MTLRCHLPEALVLIFCVLISMDANVLAAETGNIDDSISGAIQTDRFGSKRLADAKSGTGGKSGSKAANSKSTGDAQKLLVDGKKLLSEGRNQEAEPLLRKAVNADQSNAEARLNYGMCLYHLNRYWGALSQLEKALELDKDNAQAYLFLGHCYSKTRKFGDAVRSYENYMAVNTSKDDAEKYQALINALKQQVASIDSKQVEQGTVAGDYMKETTATGLFRWPESRMPITVYIEPADSITGYRPEFDDVLRHAFQEWQTATRAKVRFEVVNKPDDAEMIVSWTDDLHAPELTAEAGKASVVQDSDGIKSAELKLLTVSPFKEGPLGSQALYLVCLHELGHALGLLGHSPYPNDIMYPILSEQSGITPRDAQTFAVVYAAADESQVVASGAKSAGDETEFSRLTPANQAALLLKIGTKAVFAQKYAESIVSLEKALKLDPSNALAKSNLAVAANNLSLQAKSDEERLNLLHKALFWNPDSESARTNMKTLLNNMGISVDDPAARVKFADKLEHDDDLMGASVELAESLRLKQDPKVNARLQALRTKLGAIN